MLAYPIFLLIGLCIGGFFITFIAFLEQPEEEKPAVTRPTPVPSGRSARVVHGLQRRLQRELALAQAYADDPNLDTLWADVPDDVDP